ncbi:MAG: TauD/TfdA family dioxygenase [Pseudomonadota bacterium]
MLKTVHLSRAQKAELSQAMSADAAFSTGQSAGLSLVSLETAGRGLRSVSEIGKEIEALSRQTGEIGVLLVKTGKDFLWSTPTPSAHSAPESHKLSPLDAVRILLQGKGNQFGFAHKNQANGNLCDDVMPLLEHHDTVGFSQGRSLGWHTEDAVFNRPEVDLSPDIISLAFLRAREDDIASISMPNVDDLSLASKKALEREVFVARLSLAHGAGEGRNWPMKSLIYNGSYLRVSFARIEEDREIYLSNGTYGALLELRELLDAYCVDIKIEAGDILFIDNKRVAHCRKPYASPPRYNGTDRWQRRLISVHGSRASAVDDCFLDGAKNLPRVIDADKAIAKMER